MKKGGKRAKKIRHAVEAGIRRWPRARAWSPARSERQAFLDAIRTIGDPVTDPLIAQVFAAEGHEGLRRLNKWFLQAHNPDPWMLKRLPQPIRAFLEAPVGYPAWVDQERIEQAYEMFLKWGMQVLLLLFMKALPQFFANEGASQVFYQTKAFAKDKQALLRFVIEMIQLLIDVMEPGNLTDGIWRYDIPDQVIEPADAQLPTGPEPRPRRKPAGAGSKGRGVLALQKLRLHHSIIRFYLLNPVHSEPWKPAWGTPINQEDLVASMLAFTLYNIEGFKKLDLKLTEHEQETTLMMWKMICFLLGLDERLQPANLAEAQVLLKTIEARQSGPCVAGTALTRQLIDVMRGFLPFFIKNVPVILTRYLVDRSYLKRLKVPRTFGPSWLSMSIVVVLLSVFRFYNWAIGRFFPGLQVFILEKSYTFLTRRLFPHFIRGASRSEGRHGTRGAFRLPGWTQDPRGQGASVREARMWRHGRKKKAAPSS